MGPAGGASSLGKYGGSSNRPDRDSRDRDAGVTPSAVGTLADPTEKQDYFGSTIFGPSQKYTGSFLDNILGGGYRNVDPYTGQFQSRFSQAGGLGKSIFGGILGLINPFLGMAYRVGSSLPRLGNYNYLADYARGELGLFQKPGINIDKGRGSIINQLYIVFYEKVNKYIFINYIPGIETPSSFNMGLKISWTLLLISLSDKVLEWDWNIYLYPNFIFPILSFL
mgnify:CR=1 FL=1